MREQKLATKPTANDRALQSSLMDAALEVHKNLGLGFGQEEYSRALAHEMTLRNIAFETKRNVKISYKGSVAGEYLLDFVVQDILAVAVLSGNHLTDMDDAKLKSILKATKMNMGLIINFSKDILEIRTVER